MKRTPLCRGLGSLRYGWAFALIALVAFWGCCLFLDMRASAQEPPKPPKLPADGAAAVDLRPAFREWGLPVRAQGGRGTCSVFTLTGALEYALASRQHAGTVLSVEFLNWAANQAAGRAKDGGFFSDLWRGFEAYGICSETNLAYQPDYDPRRQPGADALAQAREVAKAGLRLHWIKPWDVTTGVTDQQLREIQRTLAQGWPVCGGFRWPKQALWRHGVLQMTPPSEVFDGHSVLLVGFQADVTQPGGGTFLIRNSAGAMDDQALPYAYVQVYLNDAAWIEPKPDAGT